VATEQPRVKVAYPCVLGETVEIIEATCVPTGIPVNTCDSLGICFKLGCGHDVWCEGRTMRYPDDAVCVRAPGCYWSCDPCRDGFVSIDIPTVLLPEEMRADRMHFVPAEPTGVLRPATLRRLAEQRISPPEAEELLSGLLLNLSQKGVLCAPDLGTETRYRGVVRQAREFLQHNLAEKLSLPQIARAVGTTRWGLIRAFARETGITPHAFHIQLRLGRARQLLRRGHSPAEVAAIVGFADQAHFTRLLRRFSGESPRVYMMRHWRLESKESAGADFRIRGSATSVQAFRASTLIDCRVTAAGGC